MSIENKTELLLIDCLKNNLLLSTIPMYSVDSGGVINTLPAIFVMATVKDVLSNSASNERSRTLYEIDVDVQLKFLTGKSAGMYDLEYQIDEVFRNPDATGSLNLAAFSYFQVNPTKAYLEKPETYEDIEHSTRTKRFSVFASLI